MQLRLLGLWMVCVVGLAACGDNDGIKDGKDAAMDAGPDSKLDAGSDDASTGGSITCGSKPGCKLPMFDLALLFGPLAAGFDTAMLGAAPCCTEASVCGVKSSVVTGGMCVEQDQVGKVDTSCSPYKSTINFGSTTLPVSFKGCCRPDNSCGLDLKALGVGCVERTEASKLAMMGAATSMIDAGFDAGAPLAAETCSYDGSNTGNDAGSDDAGR